MYEYCPMRHQKNGNCLPVGGFCPNAVSEPICEAMHSAYQMGFDAGVISEQRAEKNVPLTLDDLKEMDGQPVWIVPGANCFGNCPPHWRIWNEHEYYDFECFKAYRRPPGKEESNED